MKKIMITAFISGLALAGMASATQILQTPPAANTTKPVVRPSLNKVLDKRPTIPTKPAVNTGTIAKPVVRPVTGTVATGSIATGVRAVVQTIVQQNAADVQAYREENGYITRYLIKQTTIEAKKTMAVSVEKTIKTLLAAQKSLRQVYDDGAKSSTGKLMTKETWNTGADTAVDAYRSALLPYINTAKIAEFEKFIIGRKNLLKGIFDKLETIRLVKIK